MTERIGKTPDFGAEGHPLTHIGARARNDAVQLIERLKESGTSMTREAELSYRDRLTSSFIMIHWNIYIQDRNAGINPSPQSPPEAPRSR